MQYRPARALNGHKTGTLEQDDILHAVPDAKKSLGILAHCVWACWKIPSGRSTPVPCSQRGNMTELLHRRRAVARRSGRQNSWRTHTISALARGHAAPPHTVLAAEEDCSRIDSSASRPQTATANSTMPKRRNSDPRSNCSMCKRGSRRLRISIDRLSVQPGKTAIRAAPETLHR